MAYAQHPEVLVNDAHADFPSPPRRFRFSAHHSDGWERGLGDQLLSCFFIAVTAWAGNQILAKPLHLYGRFLYLLSIFVALPG